MQTATNAPETAADILASLPDWLHQMVERSAARVPEAIAISQPDGLTITYGGLNEAISSVSELLSDNGIRPGDRVLIVNENCAAGAALFFASSRLRAWPVFLNARQSAREVAEIQAHSGARRAFYTHLVSPEAAAHADAAGAVEIDLGAPGKVRMGPLADAMQEPVSDDPARQVGALIYTSGTTGSPKGVMLSHEAANFVASSPGSQKRLEPGDQIYGVLPVSHVFGLTSTFLRAMYGGAHLWSVPRFDPVHVFEALESGAITVFQGVPQMYAKLLEYAAVSGRKLIAPNLKFAVIGGASVDPALKAAAEDALGLRLAIGYGMTEFASTVTRSLPKHVGRDITAGPPLPGIEAVAVSEDGSHLPQGQAGEIWLRGPNRMLGYYRNPAATADVITPDGWYRTGDIGYLDDEGCICFVERAREVIIRGGFNVYPVEVEGELTAHPDITLAAVVGASKAGGDEEIIAFVQPVPGRTIDGAGVLAWLRDRLAAYKIPSRLIVKDPLPAAATGKILKARLRELLAGENVS